MTSLFVSVRRGRLIKYFWRRSTKFRWSRSAFAVTEGLPHKIYGVLIRGDLIDDSLCAGMRAEMESPRPDDVPPQCLYRAVGAAPGGPAAGDRPRLLCRRHFIPPSTSYAHRALGRRPWPHRDGGDSMQRAHCRACLRYGRLPTLPTCRPSISARAGSNASNPTGSRCWRPNACAMWASRSPPCSPRTPMWGKTPPTSSKSTPSRCRCCSMPMRSRASFRLAAAPRLPLCARAMAMWTPPWRAPARSSSLTSRSAATPACRSRPAVPSAAMTRPATFSNFTAPRKCRTGCASCSR